MRVAYTKSWSEVLEACTGVIGPDVSKIVCRISSFEDFVAQVIMTEQIETGPTAEEKWRVLSSLRPVVEQREHSTVNARTTLEDSETQCRGCINHLADVKSKIVRLQVEETAINLEVARLDLVVNQNRAKVAQLESEGEAARKQVEDLEIELRDVPNPALTLTEAKATMEATRKDVMKFITGCLEKL